MTDEQLYAIISKHGLRKSTLVRDMIEEVAKEAYALGAANMRERAAETAYAELDDPFLSGHGYATTVSKSVRALEIK